MTILFKNVEITGWRGDKQGCYFCVGELKYRTDIGNNELAC